MQEPEQYRLKKDRLFGGKVVRERRTMRPGWWLQPSVEVRTGCGHMTFISPPKCKLLQKEAIAGRKGGSITCTDSHFLLYKYYSINNFRVQNIY